MEKFSVRGVPVSKTGLHLVALTKEALVAIEAASKRSILVMKNSNDIIWKNIINRANRAGAKEEFISWLNGKGIHNGGCLALGYIDTGRNTLSISLAIVYTKGLGIVSVPEPLYYVMSDETTPIITHRVIVEITGDALVRGPEIAFSDAVYICYSEILSVGLSKESRDDSHELGDKIVV